MAIIQASEISRIDGGQISDDGNFLLLKMTQADGSEIVLAIPSSQMTSLVDMSALGLAQAHKIKNPLSQEKVAYKASWWELGRDQPTESVILSLTFGAGGTLNFILPQPMPQAILDTLQVMLGQSNPPTPTTKPN